MMSASKALCSSVEQVRQSNTECFTISLFLHEDAITWSLSVQIDVVKEQSHDIAFSAL